MSALSRPADLQSNIHQLSQPDEKGISLSQMLLKVNEQVESLPGAWVQCEVSQIKENKGHLYLELVEHDENGTSVAKCSARIWANKRQSILSKFEAATGSKFVAGIKILIRAVPKFHIQHSFSLDINDIDPAYTLGDMQRKLQEIRNRLNQEGIFDLNKSLTCPDDFMRVAVIAPEEAAGLGDFNATVKPLHQHDLCRFKVYKATFQGASTSSSICEQLAAIKHIHEERPICAVVVIRGGGAVTDLAHLNDYAIAKSICMLGIPVLTGIGHEKDSTILDEVCTRRFDTPSKVAAFIQDAILGRAKEANDYWTFIINSWDKAHQRASHNLQQTMTFIQHEAIQVTTNTSHDIRSHWDAVQNGVNEAISFYPRELQNLIETIKDASTGQLAYLEKEVQDAMSNIAWHAPNSISAYPAEIQSDIELITTTAQLLTDQLRAKLEGDMQAVKDNARSVAALHQSEMQRLIEGVKAIGIRIHQEYFRHINDDIEDVKQIAIASTTEAKQDVDRTFQEVMGLGPKKTLNRGFLIARSDGKPVTTAEQAKVAGSLDLEFKDGHATANQIK